MSLQGTGAITQYIDVAQLTLYAFWLFFAGLIIYLRREDKREGYPLESDRNRASDRVKVQGFPAIPKPKTFILQHGGTSVAPNNKIENPALRRATATGAWPGAPLEPTGNPLLAGVGAGAYADRADTPDLTFEGNPRVVPLRVATDHHVESRDPDPRGMEVVGADGVVGGIVRDVWVDRSEVFVRYLEVEVTANGRHVLLPIAFARISGWRRQVKVKEIMGRHFADVPSLKNPDQVTLLEEDRISAYYAAGIRYADPSRLEPLV
jgi:photosynthetic reaction center H subunit